MKLRKLLPSQTQWNKWGLPSKLTAIGTYLALLIALITFIYWIINQIFPKRDYSKENYEILSNLENFNVSNEEVFELFHDISKDFKEELDEELFKVYANTILSIYKQLIPNAKIRLNEEIVGSISKEKYRIDLLVESKISGHNVLLAIKIMPTRKPIKKSQLLPFKFMLEDIQATKGVIISNSGFEEDAIDLANKNLIDLCFIHDSESHDWKDDILIPVVWIEIQPHVNTNMLINFSKGDKMHKDLRSWKVIKNGRDTFPLLQLFIEKWNKKEIPHRNFKEKKIQINSNNLELILNKNRKKQIENLVFSYKTTETCWLKYFKPDRYKAIENYISGDIELSQLEMGISPIKRDSTWKKINDYEYLFRNNKVSVLMTSQPMNIQVENTKIDDMKFEKLDKT